MGKVYSKCARGVPDMETATSVQGKVQGIQARTSSDLCTSPHKFSVIQPHGTSLCAIVKPYSFRLELAVAINHSALHHKAQSLNGR